MAGRLPCRNTSGRPRARSWPPPAVRTPPGWNTCIPMIIRNITFPRPTCRKAVFTIPPPGTGWSCASGSAWNTAASSRRKRRKATEITKRHFFCQFCWRHVKVIRHDVVLEPFNFSGIWHSFVGKGERNTYCSLL